MNRNNGLTSLIIYVGIILLIILFFNVLWILLPILLLVWVGWTLYRVFFPKKTKNMYTNQNHETQQTAKRSTKISEDTIDVDYEVIDE